jgi:hypothetical protein
VLVVGSSIRQLPLMSRQQQSRLSECRPSHTHLLLPLFEFHGGNSICDALPRPLKAQPEQGGAEGALVLGLQLEGVLPAVDGQYCL